MRACHAQPQAALTLQKEHSTSSLTRGRGDEVLLQHRVDDRVDVLIQVLKQEGEAVLDSKLQLLQEVCIVEGLDLCCV